jgi:hypothetical protein
LSGNARHQKGIQTEAARLRRRGQMDQLLVLSGGEHYQPPTPPSAPSSLSSKGWLRTEEHAAKYPPQQPYPCRQPHRCLLQPSSPATFGRPWTSAASTLSLAMQPSRVPSLPWQEQYCVVPNIPGGSWPAELAAPGCWRQSHNPHQSGVDPGA